MAQANELRLLQLSETAVRNEIGGLQNPPPAASLGAGDESGDEVTGCNSKQPSMQTE